jgi:inhibitor of cysteine peptidase
MIRLLLFMAALGGAATLRAQEESRTPAALPPVANIKAPGSPKMNEAVNLTGTAPAENMEIPPPAGEEAPEKTEEISGKLPDEEEGAAATPVTGKVEVTVADAGKVVRAAAGNLIAITLQSNPSTGYNWELRDFDYGVADFYKSETLPAGDGNVLFGAPGKTVVTLQAVNPGTQDIKLVYRRLWEPPDQVAETFAFRLQVEGPDAPPETASPSPKATPAP